MTTLESLSALPDDQLIEKVAVEVMGWEKYRLPFFNSDEYWHPKGNRSEYIAHVGTPLLKPLAGRTWNPLTDFNHALEVLEALAQRNFDANGHMGEAVLNLHHTCERYCVELYGHDYQAVVRHDDMKRAICLAALLAVSPKP